MRNKTSKLSLIAAAALFFAALIPATSASAHAELETSNPEANSMIGAAPQVVSLTFGEKLMVVAGQDTANQVQVTDGANARVDNGDYQVTGEVLTVSLKPDLADDTYKVTYRVVSEDGHPIEGVYEFTVNGMARTGAVPVDEVTPSDGSTAVPDGVLYDIPVVSGDPNSGSTIGWSVAIGAAVVGVAMFFLFRRIRSEKK
jgi:methionine-rich copper-binding protein CopC